MKRLMYFVLFFIFMIGLAAGVLSKDVSIIDEYKTQIVIFSVFSVISVSIFSRMTSK